LQLAAEPFIKKNGEIFAVFLRLKPAKSDLTSS